jgi:hypothetical protein
MTCTDTDARTSARIGEDAGGALITRRSRVQIPPPPPCGQVRGPPIGRASPLVTRLSTEAGDKGASGTPKHRVGAGTVGSSTDEDLASNAPTAARPVASPLRRAGTRR